MSPIACDGGLYKWAALTSVLRACVPRGFRTCRNCARRLGAAGGARWGSPEPFVSPGRGMPDSSRPTSPDGLGGGLHSSYTMGQGLEGLIFSASPAARPTRRAPAREHPTPHFAEIALAEGLHCCTIIQGMEGLTFSALPAMRPSPARRAGPPAP